MATFKVVVRKKRADGFYPVYIRVVHRSRMGYIKTDKLITDKQITKNGEIRILWSMNIVHEKSYVIAI